MPFPTPLYVLLKGGTYLTVSDAVSETKEDIMNYEGGNYRDLFSNDTNGAADGVSNAGIQLLLYPVGPYPFIIKGSENSAPTSQSIAASTRSASDEVMHIPPRNELSRRTMIRWWSGASFVMSTTTVNNSTTLTVASTANMAVGQSVAGTGIPSGAVILSITNATTFVISIAATASATVTGTYSNGNLVGECWLDRFIGWSGGKPVQ